MIEAYPIAFFVLASVLTVIAAMKLAHYGDAIADTTGLGHSLVGLILLSAATSLPELFSSSSASYIGNVDLSFGNVFGSNMTNIFILVILDFFVRNKPILLGASQKNIMTGGIVIFVTSIALLMIYLSNPGMLKEKGFVDIDFWFFSPILLIIYLGAMFVIYQYESSIKTVDDPDQGPVDPKMTKRKAITGFLMASVLVFGAAILLSYSADEISKLKVGGQALGGTFVGTLFMAFTTSLPEIVVSIAALRIGSHDMALGNLFGSNLFNLAVLSFSDGFYRLGKYTRDERLSPDAFSKISTDHIISGLVGILFVGIVLSSLILRRQTKRGPLGFDTFIIGVLYLLTLFVLYSLR